MTAVYVEGDACGAAAARRRCARSRATLAGARAPRWWPSCSRSSGYALVRAGVVRWPPARCRSPSLAIATGVVVVQPGGSIAAAIEQAGAGGQVVVEPGEYRERLRLKDGVRVVSRVPRGATLRMPVGTAEGRAGRRGARRHAAPSWPDFASSAMPPRRSVSGVLVERADVALVDSRCWAPSTAAVELEPDAAGSFIGGDVHDNPGAGLVIRSGASSRISHSGFAKNGVSERDQCASHRRSRSQRPARAECLRRRLARGVPRPDAEAAAAALRDNWFPGLGIHVARPVRHQP